MEGDTAQPSPAGRAIGARNLRGKSTKQRAEAPIAIAHPDFRAELTAAARSVTLI